MKGYNIIVVFDETAEKVLMCRRRKKPYQGLANFVGGKINKGAACFLAVFQVWVATLYNVCYDFIGIYGYCINWSDTVEKE